MGKIKAAENIQNTLHTGWKGGNREMMQKGVCSLVSSLPVTEQKLLAVWWKTPSSLEAW